MNDSRDNSKPRLRIHGPVRTLMTMCMSHRKPQELLRTSHRVPASFGDVDLRSRVLRMEMHFLPHPSAGLAGDLPRARVLDGLAFLRRPSDQLATAAFADAIPDAKYLNP